jgi:hypothetical protein
MKIKYSKELSDVDFIEHMKNMKYPASVKAIQAKWAKITACKLELINLLSEIANITPPKNVLGNDNKKEWGICLNSGILFPVPAKLRDCSVGMVRKMRNSLPEKYNDDTCFTCPYFIPENALESRTNEQITKHASTSLNTSK